MGRNRLRPAGKRSKHRVLSLKPQLRLERQGQDGQNETEQPDHSASLGDSITSSTRIRFSVHTGVEERDPAAISCQVDCGRQARGPSADDQAVERLHSAKSLINFGDYLNACCKIRMERTFTTPGYHPLT
jgi:hypothetical protein